MKFWYTPAVVIPGLVSHDTFQSACYYAAYYRTYVLNSNFEQVADCDDV